MKKKSKHYTRGHYIMKTLCVVVSLLSGNLESNL